MQKAVSYYLNRYRPLNPPPYKGGGSQEVSRYCVKRNLKIFPY